MPYLRKKNPKIMNKSEENAWRERRMTNIVLLSRFLLDISVSVALKNDQRQKTFRGMTFHRNPPNVSKTSFWRSECYLGISLATGRVKITRWLFSIYYFKVFILTSLYALLERWVSFLTDHSTPDLASAR